MDRYMVTRKFTGGHTAFWVPSGQIQPDGCSITTESLEAPSGRLIAKMTSSVFMDSPLQKY